MRSGFVNIRDALGVVVAHNQSRVRFVHSHSCSRDGCWREAWYRYHRYWRCASAGLTLITFLMGWLSRGC